MPKFEEYLQHCLDDVTDSQVKKAMLYSLMAGGKRIRPRLLLATLQAYGMDESIGMQCGVAIEMIHTYSLIHDDLPAMDNDTLRRGKPTCHVQYGEAMAILAGDALLTQAFVLGSRASENACVNAKIVHTIAQYSGANGMILGQVKDLEGEKTSIVDVAALQTMHIYKTGKLLTLPFVCAAHLAKRDTDIPIWEKIGEHIGLSFQIQDDILDVTSEVETLGKNIQSDLANDKSTYVTLLGIERSQKEALQHYQEATSLLTTLHLPKEDTIQVILDELIRRKS